MRVTMTPRSLKAFSIKWVRIENAQRSRFDRRVNGTRRRTGRDRRRPAPGASGKIGQDCRLWRRMRAKGFQRNRERLARATRERGLRRPACHEGRERRARKTSGNQTKKSEQWRSAAAFSRSARSGSNRGLSHDGARRSTMPRGAPRARLRRVDLPRSRFAANVGERLRTRPAFGPAARVQYSAAPPSYRRPGTCDATASAISASVLSAGTMRRRAGASRCIVHSTSRYGRPHGRCISIDTRQLCTGNACSCVSNVRRPLKTVSSTIVSSDPVLRWTVFAAAIRIKKMPPMLRRPTGGV
ncbi:hypothetical protein DM47_2896 [Burkholderia mallei]|nr:hypothetical protein DM47_2896 [Burkholderia mallei]